MRHGTIGIETGGFPGALEFGEIDMCGQVGFAGARERFGVVLAAHGLQRVAEAGRVVAVVDKERRNRCVCGTRRKRRDERFHFGAYLEDRAFRRIEVASDCVTLDEDESSIVTERH